MREARQNRSGMGYWGSWNLGLGWSNFFACWWMFGSVELFFLVLIVYS